jgi:hypothetical protein
VKMGCERFWRRRGELAAVCVSRRTQVWMGGGKHGPVLYLQFFRDFVTGER